MKKMLNLFNMMKLYHRSDIDFSVMKMYAIELQNHDPEVIKKAWEKYRMNPKNVFMPTPAQLIQFIDDGRPDVNEAWAMIPWDENLSVVWNDEISQAYKAAYPLYKAGQKNSAFFAFKEVYEKLVFEKRKKNIKPNWELSEGFDRELRISAVKEAISKGYIDENKANYIYPEFQLSAKENFLLESTELKNENLEYQRKRRLMVKELLNAVNSNDLDKLEKLKEEAEKLNG